MTYKYCEYNSIKKFILTRKIKSKCKEGDIIQCVIEYGRIPYIIIAKVIKINASTMLVLNSVESKKLDEIPILAFIKKLSKEDLSNLDEDKKKDIRNNFHIDF